MIQVYINYLLWVCIKEIKFVVINVYVSWALVTSLYESCRSPNIVTIHWLQVSFHRLQRHNFLTTILSQFCDHLHQARAHIWAMNLTNFHNHLHWNIHILLIIFSQFFPHLHYQDVIFSFQKKVSNLVDFGHVTHYESFICNNFNSLEKLYCFVMFWTLQWTSDFVKNVHLNFWILNIIVA